jgi:sulfate adenylyltransferase subunit 2
VATLENDPRAREGHARQRGRRAGEQDSGGDGPRPDSPTAPRGGHLARLEAEAVFVVREVLAESRRPALLFSGGKDSAVLAEVVRRAAWPEPFPMPLLHVDTGHNFPEVLAFRDETAGRLGAPLVVASVEAALAAGRVPDPGPLASRNRLQSAVLLDAVAAHGFDCLLGGARRDEDKARAKERVVSVRDQLGGWDPRRQRPEIGPARHARPGPGEHLRVFPLSDWTELDVWEYVVERELPLPSLYYSHSREVVFRDGMLLAISEVVVPRPGERVERADVRFRTVGDLTCTGAVRSAASTPEAVWAEVAVAELSERGATRADDRTSESAMEERKREGYF